MESDRNFLERRALEERSAAMQSADLRVRRVHLELADRYDRLVRDRELRLGYSIMADAGAAAGDALTSKG